MGIGTTVVEGGHEPTRAYSLRPPNPLVIASGAPICPPECNEGGRGAAKQSVHKRACKDQIASAKEASQ